MLLVAAGWTGTAPIAAASAEALSVSQTAAIQGIVQTALANVDPSLTGDARQQAVKSALEQATNKAIQIYGSSAIEAVTNAAIANGVPVPQVVAAVLPVASNAAGVSSAVSLIAQGAAKATGSATQVA